MKNNIYKIITLCLIMACMCTTVSAAKKTIKGTKTTIPKGATQQTDESAIAILRNVQFTTEPRYDIAVARLDNGKVRIAWETIAGNKVAGESKLYTQSLQSIGTHVYHTTLKNEGKITEHRAIAFSNGNVLIAYNYDKQKGAFIVINQQNRIIRGPVEFNNTNTPSIALTRLMGGKTVLIAYHRNQGSHGSGKCVVVNAAGQIINGPSTFNDKGLTHSISAATLTNGLIRLTYECGGGKTKIIDPYLQTIKNEKKFYSKRINGITTTALNNGNTLIAYIDTNGKGKCIVMDQKNTTRHGPHTIHNNIRSIKSLKLNNGNVFMTFIADSDEKGMCTVVDTKGNRIKEIKSIMEGYKFYQNTTAPALLQDNKVIIVFCASKKGSYSSDVYTGYVVMK
ncbi:hypothetical protein ACFL56_02320 [Candidatus Margulisiibacteriota bacterium]